MATSLPSSSIYLRQLSKFNELSALLILGGNLVSLISGFGHFRFRSFPESVSVLFSTGAVRVPVSSVPCYKLSVF